MHLPFCLLFVYLLGCANLFTQSNGEVKFEEVKNAQNVTQFKIIDSKILEVANNHRNSAPSLKLSINGRTIDSLHRLTSTSWSLKLAGTASSIELTQSQPSLSFTEYSLLWHGIDHHPDQELCLHYGQHSAFWYAGYVSNNSAWPLETTKKIGPVQFNRMFEFERLSAPDSLPREWQFILEHLLLNSDGFAVHLDLYQPLFIRRDAPPGGEPVICFSVNTNTFNYHWNNFTSPTDFDLKLRLFASTNIRAVSEYVVHQSAYISKPTEIPANLDLIRYPIWFAEALQVGNRLQQNQDQLLAFADLLTSHGLPVKGQIVIQYYKWINYTENYAVNTKLFPNFKSISSTLTSKGLSIGGSIEGPLLSKSTLHPENEAYLLHGRSNNSLDSIDLSKPEAVPFYSSLLSKLKSGNGISTLWLESFITSEPLVFAEPKFTKFPSLLAPKFIETAVASNATIVAEFAYKSQHLPGFTRLVNYFMTSPGQLLKELIPNMLSASISGYSFLVPYSIGAFDSRPPPIAPHPINEEVFIRLLQATTFMPSMSFTKTPWSLSKRAVELTKKYVSLHLEHSETIIGLARKRVSEGTPILWPMWYAMPDDPKAYPIGDQFMLGENILVAPVVAEGARERTVYLPPGKWADQHGKSYTGPGQITVLAPLEELPYFKKAL